MSNLVYDCDIENSAYHVISMDKTVEEAYKIMQGLVSKELLEQMYYDYHSTKGDIPKKAKKTRTVIVENNGKIEAIKVPVEETEVEETNNAEGKSLEEIVKMAKKHTYLIHNNDVRHAKKLIGAMKSWRDDGVYEDRSTRKGCAIVWDDGTETEVKSYENAMKLINATADKIIMSDNVSKKMASGIEPINIVKNIPSRRGQWINRGLERLIVKIGGMVSHVKVVYRAA